MGNRSTSDGRSTCTCEVENHWLSRGYRYIAGLDEVGRGALAGPLVAAAVILDLERIPDGIDDSKKLPPSTRERLSEEIRRTSVCFSIVTIESTQVDQLNVGRATRLAMKTAVEALEPRPDVLLIDALQLPDVEIPQESIVHGDTLSVSIAAASIIAKVSRDDLMRQYDQTYPGYGFARNVGYGTRQHRQALQKLGPTDIHRFTFRGVSPRLFPM